MRTIQQEFQIRYSYPVIFTRDAFGNANRALIEALQRSGKAPNRVLAVIDSGLVQRSPGLPQKIASYAGFHKNIIDLVSLPHLMTGGEACKKNPAEAEKLQSLIERHNLCRHSFVLAVGGGAVLDVAGFAAATAHRGIRLIRVPTTTLSQNDGGVGVKNGINAFGRKNFLGTFAVPFAVVNDFDFLKTLSIRDLRAGFAEAVKVALIKDRAFFEFLWESRKALASFEAAVVERMVITCAGLHLDHIAGCGDPFEFGSSRPLDFGHWSAHKLEERTSGEINHGEAVAVGMALDALYCHKAGYLGGEEAGRILTLLEDMGFTLFHSRLGEMDIETAMREFQEHLGGELTIPLLKGIGEKFDVHEIDTAMMNECVGALGRRQTRLRQSAIDQPSRTGHPAPTESC